MPCLTGRSKHNLCKPKVCEDEELCPCTPTPAFSCRPACDENECCKDREAYGRILLEGATGPRIDSAISTQGIASVEQFDGNTGLFTVTFIKGHFSDCGGAPVVNLTPCALTNNETSAQVYCFGESDVTSDELIVRYAIDGTLSNGVSSGFFIRAIQKASC